MNRMLTLAGALTLALSATLPATAQAGYTTTKYPMVLVHGIFGFNNFLGADYFYQIPSTLTAEGGKVFVSTVRPPTAMRCAGSNCCNRC